MRSAIISILSGFLLITLTEQAFCEPKLRLIGALAVPVTADGKNSFGGISGLDYNPRTQRWVMISDDKSDYAPSRFYEAKLKLTSKGIRRIRITRTVTLTDENGYSFAGSKSETEVADGESIRFDPKSHHLIWSTEGYPEKGYGPKLRLTDQNARVVGRVPLPEFMRFNPDETSGLRKNMTTEGLSYSADGQSLWVSLEGPLIEDGPVPTTEHGGLTRLIRLDHKGQVLAQYAYPLDAIIYKNPEKFADNGISEILSIDDNHLLVLERAGEQLNGDDFRFHVRLYEVDLKSATPVGAEKTPVSKRLLMDFDNLSGLEQPDNYEAMSFGPMIKGKKSLVIMSDNNFSPHQQTQMLLFEFTP